MSRCVVIVFRPRRLYLFFAGAVTLIRQDTAAGRHNVKWEMGNGNGKSEVVVVIHMGIEEIGGGRWGGMSEE